MTADEWCDDMDRQKELSALRARLAEAEALLRDIRRGERLWVELNERIDAFLAPDSGDGRNE